MFAQLLKNKKHVSAFLLVTGLFLLPHTTFAFAGEETLKEILWTLVNVIFGNLAWLGGLMLNYSITEFVLGFGSFFNDSGVGTAVNLLWEKVRDIFNLLFIFGIIYIGFKMILNSDDSNAKRMLGSLIVAALLINFSLFITKAVIDFSNTAGVQIMAPFKVINPGEAQGEYRVSDRFMQILQLSQVQGQAPGEDAGKKLSFAQIVGTMYLYVAAAFVFLAGGILLMIRFVVLNFYMILSPVLFLGMIFPNMAGISRDYWNSFLKRAFFAPAYLLMIYFSFRVLEMMSNHLNIGDKKITDTFGTDGKVAGDAFGTTIMFFVIAIAFLVASLVVAQKMGGQVGNMAVSYGKKAASKVGNYTKRTVTAPVRYPARSAANWTGEKLTKKFNNLQTGSGKMARIAKTNFVDRKVRATTGAMEKVEFGTGTTNQAEKDYREKTNIRANDTEAQNIREANFEKHTEALEKNSTSEADLKKALDELGKTMKQMSKNEKNELGYKKLNRRETAINLTDDDIKNLTDSGKYSKKEVDDIKTTRKQALIATATGGNVFTKLDNDNKAVKDSSGNIEFSQTNAAGIDNRNTVLKGKSTKDIGNLPIEMFTDSKMIPHITPGMLEERVKAGVNVGSDEAKAIREAIEDNMILTEPTFVRGSDPDSYASLKNNRWAKWAKNSLHASNIFS